MACSLTFVTECPEIYPCNNLKCVSGLSIIDRKQKASNMCKTNRWLPMWAFGESQKDSDEAKKSWVLKMKTTTCEKKHKIGNLLPYLVCYLLSVSGCRAKKVKGWTCPGLTLIKNTQAACSVLSESDVDKDRYTSAIVRYLISLPCHLPATDIILLPTNNFWLWNTGFFIVKQPNSYRCAWWIKYVSKIR